MLKTKKVIIIISAVFLLGVIGFFSFTNQHNSKTTEVSQNKAAKGNTAENTKTNVRNDDTSNSAKLGSNQPTTTAAPADGSKKSVTVFIVDASQYDNTVEVRAYVSGVVESGVCNVVFTQGTSKITKQVAATANASSTVCATLDVPLSEFSGRGTWNVTVSYSSDTSVGSTSKDIILK